MYMKGVVERTTKEIELVRGLRKVVRIVESHRCAGGETLRLRILYERSGFECDTVTLSVCARMRKSNQ
jgi:hypothetical protein